MAKVPCTAQSPSIDSQFGSQLRYGEEVSAEVEEIYDRGLQYLAQSQRKDGSWDSNQAGAAVNGICLMAFLAHGEDPNFGPHSGPIRAALKYMIEQQDVRTGYLQDSMYHHGFGMLALAEAYGVVDDLLLWGTEEPTGNQRTVGSALELAVRCAVTAQQKSQFGAWRYSPNSTDADTSVSGAVLMGLLAARNAGIEVPDVSIDRALAYFKSCTHPGGSVAYTQGMGGFGDSMNRSAIAALVYSIGKRRDWPEFAATAKYVADNLEHQPSSHPQYFRYYMAQALYQTDAEKWTRWKELNLETLRGMQRDNGAIDSTYGEAYGTGMSLLSLALDFRFLPIYER